MSKFWELLTNEYANAYDLSDKLQYSQPTIFDADGKLFNEKGKPIRWYVYYSFRNPKTGKLERQTPIYNNVNRYKTLPERKKAIKILCNAITSILENGYNPYQDENKFSNNIKNTGIVEAFKFVRELKKNTMEDTSYKDFKSRLNQFEKWLLNNGFENRYISKVSKQAVIAYLNEVQIKSSPKNRNNTRTALSGFFQTLEDNEIVELNFVDKINVLKTTPQRNKTYTKKQEIELFEHVEATDEILLLFIKFICYTFLRPIEICRLQVRDIDLQGKKINVKTKNKPVKIKMIPQILLNDLPDLSKMQPDSYLFTKDGFGQNWEIEESNKRDYFTNKFKEVKDKLNLTINYGLYSFRHTFITKLYNSFLINSTPFEAKSKLMLITGHTTMIALEKYLRDIDAVLPDDYSQHF